MPMNQRVHRLDGRRVLVAEDEFFIADDLVRTLRRFGAQVVGPIADYEEAMAVASSDHGIDLAVIDINLNGRSAVAIADLLRSRGATLVIASGYDRSRLPPRFLDVPYWSKPFSAEALCAGIASAEQA